MGRVALNLLRKLQLRLTSALHACMSEGAITDEGGWAEPSRTGSMDIHAAVVPAPSPKPKPQATSNKQQATSPKLVNKQDDAGLLAQ
ncbi:hypothetical protein GGR50DRAFT_439920 [Xylaria sp. CBS 124048]|nr:hypothetical protein GGR50DRAFT_439920 [Xylaria sp. CBS 124048]